MAVALQEKKQATSSANLTASDFVVSGYSIDEAEFLEVVISALDKFGSLNTDRIAEILGRSRKATQHQLMLFGEHDLLSQQKRNDETSTWSHGAGLDNVERYHAQKLKPGALPKARLFEAVGQSRQRSDCAVTILRELNRDGGILPRETLLARVRAKVPVTPKMFGEVLQLIEALGCVRRWTPDQSKARRRRGQNNSPKRRRRSSNGYSISADGVAKLTKCVPVDGTSPGDSALAKLPSDERELLRFITPETTHNSPRRCEKLRRYYAFLVINGPCGVGFAGLADGDSPSAASRLLHDGMTDNVGLFHRDVRSFYPNPQPDIWSALPAGLRALQLKASEGTTGPTSILDRLPADRLEKLEWVDWEAKKVSSHMAWRVACLLALVGNKREATKSKIATEMGGISETELTNIAKVATRLKLLTFRPKRGVGTLWVVHWDAVDGLPKVPSRVPLEPHRSIQPYFAIPKASRCSTAQQQILDRAKYEETGLTYGQWIRSRQLIEVTGTTRVANEAKLADELDVSVHTLPGIIAKAARAGLIEAKRLGGGDWRITVNWERIEELARELLKPAGYGKPKTQAAADTVDPPAPPELDKLQDARKKGGESTRKWKPAIAKRANELAAYVRAELASSGVKPTDRKVAQEVQRRLRDEGAEFSLRTVQRRLGV